MHMKKMIYLLVLGLCAANLAVSTAEAKPVRGRSTPLDNPRSVPDAGASLVLLTVGAGALCVARRFAK